MLSIVFGIQKYTSSFVLSCLLLVIVAVFSARGYTPSPALWSLLLVTTAIVSLPRRGYRSRIHFAPSPAIVAVRKTGTSETERLDLRQLTESKCPSVFTEFRPAWWLFNGHLQTAYCVVGDFSKVDRVIYNRTYLRLLDGGTLGIDFTPADGASLKDDAPILVVLHGLTGGSYEAYVRAVLAPACTPVEQGGLGYRGVVMNYRGCAGVPLTSPKLYSAACSDDLRQALIYIATMYPRAPLYGVGFSLGANVLVRYLAEEGDRSRLRAACAIACPWNITRNGDALNATVTGRIYSRSLGGNLLALVRQHAATIAQHAGHPVAATLPATLALKSPLMDVFDDHFTRVAGGDAPFPFPSARAYYTWASTHQVVRDVRVPFLAMNTADDPVVTEVPMDAGGNPWAVMVCTPSGGHLGWFARRGAFGLKRWSTEPILEWLRLVVEDMALGAPDCPAITLHEDGFLREDGRGHLGCKAIEGGGIIRGFDGEGGLIQGL